MKLTPIGERVLIRPLQREDKTKGGIYIPDSAKEERKEGQVVAVGTDKDGNTLPLQPGDKILYGGFSNEEFEMDDGKVIIVEFKDVVAKMEE